MPTAFILKWKLQRSTGKIQPYVRTLIVMKKLHNHRYPAGLEREILKKIPKYLAGGIVIPVFMSIMVRLPPVAGLFSSSATEVTKLQTGIDFLGIGIFFMVLSLAFTVVIGCVIVILMKGPAYIADAYDLEDADKPDADNNDNTNSKQD